MITVSAIMILLLSFTRCTTITEGPDTIGFLMSLDEQTTDTQVRYAPILVMVITWYELLLLWNGRHRYRYVAGAFLNMLAASGPFVLFKTFEAMSEMVEKMGFGTVSVSFFLPVSVIMALGTEAAVLYAILDYYAGKVSD